MFHVFQRTPPGEFCFCLSLFIVFFLFLLMVCLWRFSDKLGCLRTDQKFEWILLALAIQNLCLTYGDGWCLRVCSPYWESYSLQAFHLYSLKFSAHSPFPWGIVYVDVGGHCKCWAFYYFPGLYAGSLVVGWGGGGLWECERTHLAVFIPYLWPNNTNFLRFAPSPLPRHLCKRPTFFIFFSKVFVRTCFICSLYHNFNVIYFLRIIKIIGTCL